MDRGGAGRPFVLRSFGVATSKVKLSGTIEGRGCGLSAVAAGGAPKSAVTK